MKKIGTILLSSVLFCGMMGLVFAQNPIPNPGFESWTGTEPDGWITNNSPGLVVPVQQSSTSHSGSFSAQTETVDFGGFPYSGWVQSSFAVSQRHATLTFWYQFLPVGDDGAYAAIYMFSNGNLIGVGAGEIYSPQNSWTQAMIPIQYIFSDTPDTCQILLGVSGDSLGNDPNVGTLARIDDLAFSGVVSVKSKEQQPLAYSLEQSYPNPFNPTTTIEFSIAQASEVKLVVYNQLGQTVATLVNERLSAGSYTVDWNAEGLPSGVYYYRISAGDFTQIRKSILMK